MVASVRLKTLLLEITQQHDRSLATGPSYGRDDLIRFKSPSCINQHANVGERVLMKPPFPLRILLMPHDSFHIAIASA